MSESEIILKITPPRLPRAAIDRERLLQFWDEVHERTAILVVAPAGFGKTTLLLQWRRRWLGNGSVVAWLGADAQDDPVRFVTALSRAVHSASGRIDHSRRSGIQTLTDLLSEIAQRGARTAIIIDDAERLPDATLKGALQYLLLNAPANLSVAICSRVALPLQVAELAAKGNLATLSADDLRLRFEESIAILEKSLGPALTLDERAHLHEVTEGWPIGLQLAIAMAGHDENPGAAVRSLSARRGHLQDYFVESMLSRLPPSTVALLTRVSILNNINVELCELISGQPDGTAQLERLISETPIMMVGEDRDWIRLHSLARDFFLGRFEQLPAEERAQLHRRVSRWHAEQDLFHQAADHALAAGDEGLAQTYAARSLWTLGTLGKAVEAREWLERIPAGMLARDAELRINAAMILAFSDRNEEALAIAREIVDDPATAPSLRVAALRAASAAAAYADHLGLIPWVLASWVPLAPGVAEPLFAMTYLNISGLSALHAGATREVRELAAQASAYGDAGSLKLAAAFARLLQGVSHLWDGEPDLASAVVRPMLAEVEAEPDGRRSMIACLYASVLAAALQRQGEPLAAQSLLANRLDVIEQWGLPDSVLLAYQTLARIALGEGDERRALRVLEELEVLSERRRLPRLRLHSLAERVRVHALRHNHETIAALLLRLDEVAAEFERDELRPLQPECQLASSIAKADAALVRNDVDEAERLLDTAHALATALHRNGDVRSVMVLRSVVAWKRGSETALPLLREAIYLATVAADGWLLAHAHPLALEMAREWDAGVIDPRHTRTAKHESATPSAARSVPVHNGVLTSKESEILGLIARGMSNKTIALVLDVSPGTVKWHLKNIYLKLSANTRRHAVDRARLLGLIQP